MRRLRFLCLPLLMLLIALSAAAQEKAVTTPYYPLKVGNEWTYRSGKETVVIRVDKETLLEFNGDGKASKAKIPGFVLAISSGPREREVTEQVAVLADGIYRFSTAGKTVTPPLRFLKLPVKDGESWSIDCKTADGKEIRGKFVAGTDQIQLAGTGRIKVDTVTVTSKDFQIGNRKVSIKYWFADKIGMVKQHVSIGSEEAVTLELSSFKPAP